MFNRHSLLLEKNQCDPLEIQASERKANLSYTTRLSYSKPQERYLKKRELGRETEIRSMSTINRSLMCSSSVILAVKCPILLLRRKKLANFSLEIKRVNTFDFVGNSSSKAAQKQPQTATVTVGFTGDHDTAGKTEVTEELPACPWGYLLRC